MGRRKAVPERRRVTDPEALALEERIRTAIERYALDGAAFTALARDLFAYQVARCAPYAAYARSRGFDAATLPERVEDIPAAPARAFKEARLAAFPPEQTAVCFRTSGTTDGRPGRHEMATTALYRAALLASFDRMLLGDGARLRYALLVPEPRECPHSSLGFMMDVIARERGDGAHGWYLRGEDIDLDRFIDDARCARDAGRALCVAATAFALLALLDTLAERRVTLALPPGSRVMETGGFKGRSRSVARTELYREASRRLGIPIPAIVAEYGMTELSSQYYDAPEDRGRIEPRRMIAPPWLRAIVVDGEGRPLPQGVVGAVHHVDLANRDSVVAVETEDLGALAPGGLILLGREQGAELRGCSLDAESLLARRG